MKIKVTKYKAKAIELISSLLIMLFVYAALSKYLEFQNFQAQLGQSPLLSAYTGFVSYSILTIELLVALLLVLPKIQYIGLMCSYALMSLFTAYIIAILNYASFIPCSCGGILEDLTWKEHLVFNIVFMALSGIALILAAKNKSKALKILFFTALIATAVIAILFVKSEQTMHKENPFIRRFIQGTATKTATAELNSNTKYFAGNDGATIFLGDTYAPLHIISYDTILKEKKHFKIQLEREDFPFAAVQVRILPPYFYVMDGTVPVIYKGKIADWKANLLMYNNNYYFSKAEVISPDKIAFRAQEVKTLNNVLGTFTYKDSLQVEYAPKLLEKQIDGFFDTDGMLHYDSQAKKVLYTYFYRNQFIVADDNLNLLYRGNTIDTTTIAKLKVVHIKETGQRKIASLPATVNQITAVSNNLLFVNSKILGRFEPKELWKKAAIVDVYNTKDNTYLSSIYIYEEEKAKLKDLVVVGNNLFAIIGHQVHKYSLNMQLNRKQSK
jgi:hypothetical protein